MAWYEIPGAEQDVALCTCARLSRNLEAFPFPAWLEPAGAKEVISAVGAVLTENGFTAIDFAEISRTAACALVEKCYAGPEFIRESLPHALYLNEPCGISAMLCGQDHVRLRCIRPGLAVRDAYAGVSGVEGQLDARFDLAFDERLGYLTHDPGELGTGLCVSVLLFLPALEAAGQTGLLAARLERQGLTLHRALAGSARQEEIPLYRLSNRICFGLTEADILSLISGCAGRILESERHRRSAVSGHDLIRLTDRIHRAAGILRHACVLPMSECLRCLADLRLGASLGLLPDIRVESLTALLFDTLPASLSLASDPPASGDFNRDISRARLVRERLSQEA